MFARFHRFFITLGAVFIMLTSAQAIELDSLRQVETLKVTSAHFAEGIEFNVTLPPSYNTDKDKRYVLLLDFHPRSQPYLSGMHDWLSHNGEWPWLETIIVTAKVNDKAFAALFKTMNDDVDGHPMLDFIQQDLLASIDAKYRTNGFRIFNGFRGNGVIALYSLYHRPELFNAYIVASPNLADDYARLMTDATSRIKALTDKPRFLFLSTGDHRYEQADLENFKKLHDILKASAPSQLNWQVNYVNDGYFMAQPIKAVLSGIESVFNDIHMNLDADSAISKQGPEAILAHYRFLSEQQYGFEVSALGSLQALADAEFEQAPDKGIEVYRFATEHYPTSSWAWQKLAAAHAKQGDYTEAVKIQKNALAQAQSQSQWHIDRQQKYLDEYQQALQK